MSQESKEAAQELERDMRKVSPFIEEAKKAIPDKQLHKKLDTVKEAAQEVVRHLEKTLE